MTKRMILYDEDAARLARERLRHDGFDAKLVRDRLAGEDDDEDHPWAVLSDAPEWVLEVLADELDGWLEHDGPSPSGPVAPLDLPTEPRRVKGHWPSGT